MWIRNKVTNTLQEIHNADVIKVCRKEPDKYEVTENQPDEKSEPVATSQESAKETSDNLNDTVADIESEKIVSEEKVTESEKAEKVDYSKLKINDLRKIAKEKGIQGYMNMDQATLAAVIEAY